MAHVGCRVLSADGLKYQNAGQRRVVQLLQQAQAQGILEAGVAAVDCAQEMRVMRCLETYQEEFLDISAYSAKAVAWQALSREALDWSTMDVLAEGVTVLQVRCAKTSVHMAKFQATLVRHADSLVCVHVVGHLPLECISCITLLCF